MFTPVILAIPALVAPLTMPLTRDCQLGRFGDPPGQAQALVEFDMAVNDYARLHRRLEPAWPPPWLMADPEQIERAAGALRKAIRAARPEAVPGSLFTLAVAEVFRSRIAAALREHDDDMKVPVLQPDESVGEDGWAPAVHDAWPWGTPGTTWPILSLLPPLPPELEYRVVGRDLILLDVHAALVVDLLNGALPTEASCVERLAAPGDDFVGCAYDEAPVSVRQDDDNHGKE